MTTTEAVDNISDLGATRDRLKLGGGSERADKQHKSGKLTAREREVARLLSDRKATIPSRMGDEKAANPFLRADDPTMQARWGGGDAVATFAALRSAKDNF
jgi:acetyl-CoA carboxylase carboxyltransferase component